MGYDIKRTAHAVAWIAGLILGATGCGEPDSTGGSGADVPSEAELPAANQQILAPRVMDAVPPVQTAAGALALAAASSCKATKPLVLTRFPLIGTNGKDFMIVNYVDQDTSSNTNGNIHTHTRDYTGKVNSLARTYDGHGGLDIVLPSFREMDSDGAPVLTTSPGKVELVVNDQPDRNTLTEAELKTCSKSANRVYIRHSNGYLSRYFHFKKGSITVKKDQMVVASQVIGVAGSSGCTTAPHLHFEVDDLCGNPIETLIEDGMWKVPPVYDPPSDVMDVMTLAGAAPTSAQVLDPAPNQDGVAPHITVGVSVSAAVRGGDVVAMRLIDPNGVSSGPFPRTNTGSTLFVHRVGGLSWSFDSGGTFGPWTMEFSINGKVTTSRTVAVTTQIERHSVPASTSDVPPGHDFNAEIKRDTAAGYRPTWVDGFDAGGKTFYNAFFEIPPPGIATAARVGLTAAQHQTAFNDLKSQGFRMLQVDSYLFNGQARFASVWDTSPAPGWSTYHGVSESTHQTNFDDLTRRGFRPVNISVVNVGGQRLFTALYDDTPVGVFEAASRVPLADYQTVFDRNVGAGRRLAYVNVYRDNGVPTFTAIFNQRDSGAWSANTALTGSQFTDFYANRRSLSFFGRCVSGFDDGTGQASFATLFTTN
jgi:murein DD-endopeptidase MepM/ murein hydrolase activator NlpD